MFSCAGHDDDDGNDDDEGDDDTDEHDNDSWVWQDIKVCKYCVLVLILYMWFSSFMNLDKHFVFSICVCKVMKHCKYILLNTEYTGNIPFCI